MTRPKPTEYPKHFEYYVSLVNVNDGIKALENQVIKMQSLIGDIPEEKENYAYEEGKWTIKELLGHLTDAERVFGYRALRFARGDHQKLPGFDEVSYVKNGNFDKRTLYNLAHEFGNIRESNISLFRSLQPEDFNKKGIANTYKITVRALVYIIAGHWEHHYNIIKSRYMDKI